MDSLNLLLWLAKAMLYLATAATIGGYFIRLLSAPHHASWPWLRGYGLTAALLGLGSIVLAFAVQILQFSGQGWASFYDWELYGMLLNSQAGISWGLAAAGFIVYAVCAGRCSSARIRHVIMVSACLSILLSFTFSGHLVTSPWYAQLALLLHVLAMSLWLGSLFPLWRISRSSDSKLVASIMQRFGHLAVIFVSLLLLSGAVMLLALLLGDLRLLWQTAYGQTLLVKFSLVLVLLTLAAINKLLLVPKLVQAGVSKRLATTISLELTIGIVLLGVTAFATVIIGLHRP